MARTLEHADAVKEGPYDMKALDAPILQGSLLKAFIWFMKTPVYSAVHKSIARQSNVPQVLSEIQLPDAPQFVAQWKPSARHPAFTTAPLMAVDGTARARCAFQQISQSSGDTHPPTPYATVRDYHEAYRSGSCTPLEAMERILTFVADMDAKDPTRRWFTSFQPSDIRQQAQASTQRWQAGMPLSPLDGVPFAVKDCLDALGHETTGGTAFLGKRRPVTEEMPAVTLLKKSGAILLGKTTMHEIGLGTSGLNIVHGTAYNPHHTGHYTGGSSSGSAGVVAAGICPFAIGTDGGGSVRIPASYCGLVGLKPTNGRVGRAGCVNLDFTVATSGPIAGSVEDCTFLYALMTNTGFSGQDPSPPLAVLPAPFLPPVSSLTPLSGLTVGVFWSWFEDADPTVVEKCKAAVQLMEKLGAKVSPCCIPELEMLRVAHTATIVSEMYEQFGANVRDPDSCRQLNPDVQASLLSAQYFTSADYLQAQKIRARGTCHFQRVFDSHDVIVTPTTPTTAPLIPKGALKGGELNLNRTSESMRFVNQANFLGMPAISIPVGEDAKQLPIGLQIIGQAWDEANLLRIAATLEAQLPEAGVTQRRPKMFINPLLAGQEDAKKAAEEKPAVQKVVEEKPAVHKAADEKPAVQKEAEQKPAVQKAADEKPAVQKEAEEKPAVQKAADEKPAVQKEAEEKPAAQKVEDKPAPKKEAEDKPAAQDDAKDS